MANADGMFAISAAYRGASGTTQIVNATRARISPNVREVVVQAGKMPADARMISAAPMLAIETLSLTEYLTHLGLGSSVETVKLNYDDAGGAGVLTVTKVRAVGGEVVEIPDRERGGSATRYVLNFRVVEGSAGAALSGSLSNVVT